MKNRFPTLTQIIPVLSILCVLFYGWTAVMFLWKLSSWLFFLTFGEIAVLAAYASVTNLVESLVLLGILLLAAALLPARWLKDDFSLRGGALAITLAGSMLLINHLSVIDRLGPVAYWPLWILGALLFGMALSSIASRVTIVGRAIVWLGDQFSVFLFILLPMSVVSIVVLLARMLF
ncbi:MAG: hypothetical protein HFACDABA_02077 [Anaerolineales bacterium]|nr:hypothetical protein [Anaerolineales bacterium]